MSDQKDKEAPRAENAPSPSEKVPQKPTTKNVEPKEELKESELDQVSGGSNFRFY